MAEHSRTKHDALPAPAAGTSNTLTYDRGHEEDYIYSQNLARDVAEVPKEYFLGIN